MDVSVPYSAAITSDHLLRMEMRRVAELLVTGVSPNGIKVRAKAENLFQYPTLRNVGSVVNSCLQRLDSLSPAAVQAIAQGIAPDGGQLCLYAFMLRHRLVWDFMITVVGEHYRQRDYAWSPREAFRFVDSLREQNDQVGKWFPSTCVKAAQVINKALVETGYLDTCRSTRLNLLLPGNILEAEVLHGGYPLALSAFNLIQ